MDTKNIDNNTNDNVSLGDKKSNSNTFLDYDDENTLYPLRVVCTKLKQPYKLFYGLVHKGKYKCIRFTPNGVFYTTKAKMTAFIKEKEKFQFKEND